MRKPKACTSRRIHSSWQGGAVEQSPNVLAELLRSTRQYKGKLKQPSIGFVMHCERREGAGKHPHHPVVIYDCGYSAAPGSFLSDHRCAQRADESAGPTDGRNRVHPQIVYLT